jgi:hypothetical protein
MDSARNPWDQTCELANGSKVVIAFTIYGWQSPTGCGLTLEPKACMVVDYIPFKSDDNSLLDPIPSGFVAGCELPF